MTQTVNLTYHNVAMYSLNEEGLTGCGAVHGAETIFSRFKLVFFSLV